MVEVIANRYAVQREIGRGGMGVVWLCRDEVLGRQVAVKQIGMLPGADSADVDRVMREARLAAMLNHPNVVSIYDLAQDGDRHWLVMEYVEAQTLAELIADNHPMPLERVADVLAQVAGALAAAHEAGVVHRDVKPSNILVTPSGRAKITDFGIARAHLDNALTQTGLVTGSPAYMAPEVAQGSPATTASDVWSLGTTIFHAVEGRKPYDSDNLMSSLYQLVHTDIPTVTRTGPLDGVLTATMARQPADRWPMARVAARLRVIAGNPDLLAPDEDAAQDGTTQQIPVVPFVAAGAPTALAQGEPTESEPARPLVAAPASAPAPAASPPRGHRRVSPLILGLAAVALVGVLALSVWLVLRADDRAAFQAGLPDTPSDSGSDPSTPDPSTPDPSEPEPSEPEPSETEPSETADPETVISEFATSYLATVTEDPAVSWERLTPAFQRESGGFGSYVGFWSTIDDAQVSNVAPDPEGGTVTYDVTYTRTDGSTTSSTVTLELQESGDDYLISGES